MRKLPSLFVGLALLLAPGLAASQTGSQAASLMVLNAKAAHLDGKTLSLDGVAASAIVFSDRPARRAGYMPTADIVALWSTGSFARTPPNATVSAFAADGAQLADAVVVLKAPRLEGGKLTFDVSVLEGSIASATGPAALFIDTIWFGVGGDQGVHYIGRNQTTGGTSPAFGSKGDTSNPAGNPNPAPDGTNRPSSAARPDAPPLTVPPGNR